MESMKLQAFFNEETCPSLLWEKPPSWEEAWREEEMKEAFLGTGDSKLGVMWWGTARKVGSKKLILREGGDSKEDFHVKVEIMKTETYMYFQ